MKVFAYALRDFDEEKYFVDFCEKNGIEYGFTQEYPSPENVSLAEGYDCVTIITNPTDAAMLDRYYAAGVRNLATRSIGYDHIDIRHAKELGMKVTNVTYAPECVADFAIMMMLMAVRQMPYIMKKAELQDFSLKGKTGRDITEMTIGVIGTGRIGRTLIRHMSGFGCKMLAYDLYENDEVKKYAEYTSLDEIYANADIITLHVPGLPENHHMISDEQISKMKEGVILVNAARGMLVDTQALIRGLDSGKIGYAALDTIENEGGLYYLNHEKKILDKKERALLLAYPNVMVVPHMAFYTDRSVKDMVENALRGLVACAKGEDTVFEVTKTLG